MARYYLAHAGMALVTGRDFTKTHSLMRNQDNILPLKNATLLMSKKMAPLVTREEYLEWVTAWKKLYRQVSDVIKTLKAYRDGKRKDVGDNLWETIREFRQSDVEWVKGYATHLLQLRSINKILAARSYDHYRRLAEAA